MTHQVGQGPRCIRNRPQLRARNKNGHGRDFNVTAGDRPWHAGTTDHQLRRREMAGIFHLLVVSSGPPRGGLTFSRLVGDTLYGD